MKTIFNPVTCNKLYILKYIRPILVLFPFILFAVSADAAKSLPVDHGDVSIESRGEQQDRENRFRLNFSDMSKWEKGITLNLAGAAAIVGYGVFFWDYSLKNDYHTKAEGWFGTNTNHAGVDKCGHFYAGYLMGDFFGYFYDKWGFGRDKSAFLSFLSSVGFTTVMEIGDGFSDYGSSPEDLIANITGAAASYLLRKYPEVSEKIDLRVEYRPSGASDISTDYEYMKFLIALKAEGFDKIIKNKYLKYLELHLGYHATGFEKDEAVREKNLYIGIGFNLSRATRKYSKPISTFLKYYQMPHTYLTVEKAFVSYHVGAENGE